MSKTYLLYEPDQQLLLPAALQEWLPDDHLAYFISDVVDQLDMSEVTARYERERRGGPPYHPRMMVKVLLYGYCVGVASSRRIAQRLHGDIAFRVLAANNTPDFRTISDFRKDDVDALSGLFVQVLALCQQAGLVKLGHVALDGTKVKANASKHKAMSYQRMKEKAAQLAAEVAELLRQAQAGVTSLELWELRNSLLHMTNLDSKKVRRGSVERLKPVIINSQVEVPSHSGGYKNFHLTRFTATVLPQGIDKWIRSYNEQPAKLLQFIHRYDTIVSEARLSVIPYQHA